MRYGGIGKESVLRHTFLASGTEEDQDQDGDGTVTEALGSMVKATGLAHKQTGLSCCFHAVV